MGFDASGALNALMGLVAVTVLLRNGAAVLGALRGERGAATLVAAVNVLLAFAILAWAVKGLAGRLISR